MIAKTLEEKESLKKAKSAHKSSNSQYTEKYDKAEQKYTFNRNGLLDSERILEDNYPVYWDYLYVIDDDGGYVIQSEVQGNILQLKRNLRSLGFKALNIHSCNIKGRKIEIS